MKWDTYVETRPSDTHKWSALGKSVTCYRPQKQDVSSTSMRLEFSWVKQQKKNSEIRDCSLCLNPHLLLPLPSPHPLSSSPPFSQPWIYWTACAMSTPKLYLSMTTWEMEGFSHLPKSLTQRTQTDFLRQQSHCFSAGLFTHFSFFIFRTSSQLKTNI